jgi:hypothetical protein
MFEVLARNPGLQFEMKELEDQAKEVDDAVTRSLHKVQPRVKESTSDRIYS